jgi:hypothetical protein
MTEAYLKKLRALKSKTGIPEQLPKLPKHSPQVGTALDATGDVGFVSFDSSSGIGVSNFQNSPDPASPTTTDAGFGSFDSTSSRGFSNFQSRTLAALKARCPDGVPVDRWRQAVKDGRAFLGHWGDQAEALGWTAKDLFGLLPVPDRAAPWFDRLSRYDETGLVWLLRGRPVVALTAATAAIENPKTSTVTVYRRFNKPGLGPLGDSLDDL